ncbi:MAG: SpoVR family protein [Candidatus Hodarchaeales archaeon]|jgi:stage V sporulation protein R
MRKSELRRLIKIENRIQQIVTEDLGLTCFPIEFDIVPPQKMLEIMAYRIPTNISNWKRGRDYERARTIWEYGIRGLPYEVVINADPSKAYLMGDNKFAVQCLVMAHVYGHVAFFTNNKYFRRSRQDIVGIMYEASKRFMGYEKKYGIDEVEMTVDAGHALQWHSSPFATNETQQEKRKRVFEQEKKKLHVKGGDFKDISGDTTPAINEDIELFNQKLWRAIKLKTPVEPTEDILRYIIDNSTILEDWQKDTLEVLRMEGQYYWPIAKTKFMNEGFATFVHERVLGKLFKEGILTSKEHADYNYSNALVKAEHEHDLNPYLVGWGMWKDLEERWDKGRHGIDWDNCTDLKTKKEWDTKEMGGWNKCKKVVKTYTDWFFMQDFLTPEIVRDLKIYVFEAKDQGKHIDYVITKDTMEEIRDKIVYAFAQSMIPKIAVINGNHEEKGYLALKHNYDGVPLDDAYAKETMKHIAYLWGRPVIMDTKSDDSTEVSWRTNPENWEAGDEAEAEEKKPEPPKASVWGKKWWNSPPPTPLDRTYLYPW